jgi:hypothetical protein
VEERSAVKRYAGAVIACLIVAGVAFPLGSRMNEMPVPPAIDLVEEGSAKPAERSRRTGERRRERGQKLTRDRPARRADRRVPGAPGSAFARDD